MSQTSYRRLTCEVVDDVVLLIITESKIYDPDVVEQLREDMLQAVDQFGTQKVVVDFKCITELSSMAFRPLLSLRRKLLEANGRLILCSLSEAISDVFRTARMIGPTGELTALFEVERDAGAAVAGLNQT